MHGLYGDAFKTWEWNSPELQSKPKTGRQSSSASTENATKTILWLRDLLPTALPNTRIFTFGYNAQLNTFDTVNGLIDLAHDLLANLEAKRRNLKEARDFFSESTISDLYKGKRAHYLYSSQFGWSHCERGKHSPCLSVQSSNIDRLWLSQSAKRPLGRI